MTNEEKKDYVAKINESLAGKRADEPAVEAEEEQNNTQDPAVEAEEEQNSAQDPAVEAEEEQNSADEFDRLIEERENKRKKVVAITTAGAVVVALAIAAIVSSTIKHEKKDSKDDIKNSGNSSVTTTTPESEEPTLTDDTTTRRVLADLGIEAELPTVTDRPIVQNPSNSKIDVNKVVEDQDGNLFIDEENKEKYEEAKKNPNVTVTKDEKGNEVIVSYETKQDEYVNQDGNVYKKDEYYEVKDKEGNTVQEGKVDSDTGLPDGYIYEDGRIIPESDAGKYVVLESDYYFGDQKVYNKGEKVTKETYEDIKRQFTTKPTKTTTRVENEFIPDKTTTTTPKATTTTPKATTTTPKTTTPTPTTTTPKKTTTTTTVYVDEEGVINKDGTYTIYGTTYKSKADFEQFIIDPDSYGLYNGVIMPLEDIEKINASKSR